jgi:hypothetical protein
MLEQFEYMVGTLQQGSKGKNHTRKDVLPLQFVESELEEGPHGEACSRPGRTRRRRLLLAPRRPVSGGGGPSWWWLLAAVGGGSSSGSGRSPGGGAPRGETLRAAAAGRLAIGLRYRWRKHKTGKRFGVVTRRWQVR